MSSTKKALTFLTLTAIAASTAWLLYNKKKICTNEPIEEEACQDKTLDQRMALAEAARIKGNKFYSDKKIEEAITCYTESIALYPADHKDLRLALANRAACHLLENEFKAVIEDCTEGRKGLSFLLFYSITLPSIEI